MVRGFSNEIVDLIRFSICLTVALGSEEDILEEGLIEIREIIFGKIIRRKGSEEEQV